MPNAEKASKSDCESVNSLLAMSASVLTTTAVRAIVAIAKRLPLRVRRAGGAKTRSRAGRRAAPPRP